MQRKPRSPTAAAEHFTAGSFFLFNHTHIQHMYLDYGGIQFYPFFPSAVRAVAARCKLPSALRPGLSREDAVRTKEITKERD